MLETRDALGNAYRGDDDGDRHSGNDYRVLQPRLVSDPNRNRTEVAFDALGMVVGTAVMGKASGESGRLTGRFQADLTQATVDRPSWPDPRRRSARHRCRRADHASSTT